MTDILQYDNHYNKVAEGLGIHAEGFSEHTKNLEQVFRNTYDLYIKSLFFHWNFKGTSFISIHQFLEEQYTLLAANLDAQAERLRILGVKSRMPQNVGETQIHLNDDVPKHDALLELLRDDNYTMANQLRRAIKTAEIVGDSVSVDLLTTTLEQHEKAAWFCDASRSQ